MQRVVVTGSWRLRVGEPEAVANLSVIPIDTTVGFDKTVILLDLRLYGLSNLSGDDVPLALAYLDGEILYPKALLMRQEMHVCQFYSPAMLPSCRKDQAYSVLAQAFQKWHLALNNFECCFFEAPVERALTRGYTIDHPVHAAADKVVERLDTGRWPEFFLHLGSELAAIRNNRAVYRCSSSNKWMTVERGGRRKKKSIDSIGLRFEVFGRAGSDWVRSEVMESLCDNVDSALLELQGGKDSLRLFEYIHDIYVSGTRVGVESTRTGGIYELDFCCVRSPSSQKSGETEFLVSRNFVVRYVGGRKELQPSSIQMDIDRLSDHIADMLGLKVLDRNCPDIFGVQPKHFDIA